MLVSLEEIKGYLRIDSDAEDALLTSLADTAEQLSLAILRAKSWKEVMSNRAVMRTVRAGRRCCRSRRKSRTGMPNR